MNTRLLANVNLNYPNIYKKLPHFFRICCTKVLFNKLFGKIKTKGLNARNSFFLFPELENSLSLNQYLNVLEKKIDGESLYLNALIINNRLINIYHKDIFAQILKEKNSVFHALKHEISTLLSIFNLLNKHLFLNLNFLILNIREHKKNK